MTASTASRLVVMALGGQGAGPGPGMRGAPARLSGWQRRGCRRRPRRGGLAGVFLPPGHLTKQVWFGPAMEGCSGQHCVLELLVLPTNAADDG